MLDCIPENWESFSVRHPDEDAIRDRLLNNPQRRLVSKVWTSGQAWLKAVESAYTEMSFGVDDGYDPNSLDSLQAILDNGKACVGTAAACMVLYDTGKKCENEVTFKDRKCVFL